jgi:cytochrome c peroxidase
MEPAPVIPATFCENGLTDGKPKALGVGDKPLKRSSPTLVEYRLPQRILLGRAQRLTEAQGAAAWRGGNMGAQGKENEIVAKINGIPGYKKQFQSIFKSDATVDNIFKAITSFERTIISGDTA